MLTAVAEKSNTITEIRQEAGAVVLRSERGMLRLLPVSERILRVTYTERDAFLENRNPGLVQNVSDGAVSAQITFSESQNPGLVQNVGDGAVSAQITFSESQNPGLVQNVSDGAVSAQITFPESQNPGLVQNVSDSAVSAQITFSESQNPGIAQIAGNAAASAASPAQETISVRCGKLRLEIAGANGAISYFSEAGELLFREDAKKGRELEAFDAPIPFRADAKQEQPQEAPTESLYHTRLHFRFQEGEAIYGLGQQDDGAFELRHRTLYLHQANRKIAIPLFVSTKGYGILTDTYSPMIFSETENGAHIYTEADAEQDYYFLYGGTMEGVVAQYRRLTGKAALIPRWAFGYWQSKERYETQEEILSVAEEYRRRGLGLDAIVLDWLSWGGDHWGQKTMDPERFPDPAGMVERLRELGVQFLISVWPNMAEGGENHREMKEAGCLLPGCDVYDAFSEKARSLYWKQVRDGLFCHGIRAWWCDSSEPFTPEWEHKMKPEPGAMFAEFCGEASRHMPTAFTNAFALFHARTLYEGQRRELEAHPEDPDRRMCNLTRSAYTGQQRYGTVLWSGDTAASWETLRQQTAASLNFAASGFPYWTTDVGAFFVKNGSAWYWKGEFDDTVQDPAYCELYVRWFQWAAFLPVFRAHGTDCERELWRFEKAGQQFYRALVRANELRYEFLPYLYALAGAAWLLDKMIVKPLAFAFPEDREVRNISDQYLLGDGVMVCPVTSKEDSEKEVRRVYLPGGIRWFDFATGRAYAGGRWIDADAPLERLPLFVREGSILPMGGKTDRAGLKNEIAEFVLYGGGDASFLLYEDGGDGYGYERGEYRTVRLSYREADGEFSYEVLHDGMEPEKVTELSGIAVRRVLP